MNRVISRFAIVLVLVVWLLAPTPVSAQGTWEKVTSPMVGHWYDGFFPHFYSVFMVNPNDGWIVGSNGTILHYAGGSWSVFPSPATHDLRSVFMVNSNDGWIVGDNGTILHYSSGAWNLYTSPTTERLKSVFMVNSNDGWIVGDHKTTLHYVGGSWNLYPSGPATGGSSVSMVSSNDGWAVGGAFLHYSAGSWTLFQDGGSIYSVDMLSSNDGWAVGSNVRIYHYNGTSWSLDFLPQFTHPHWYSVDMVSSTEGWVVGEIGHIWHYSNGGWGYSPSATINPLFSVFMVNANDGWAVGAYNTIIHYSRIVTPAPTTPKPVGGSIIPANKLEILAPYFASAALITMISTVVLTIKKVRKPTENSVS